MPSSYNSRILLSVPNRLESIDRVNAAFDAFAEREGLPVALKREMNMCFDELLNNIVSYGYDDEDEHSIDIDVERTEERLVVTLTDDGKPFNPFDGRTPDVSLSVDERPIGGLGVHLVRTAMDAVSYERHGDRNVIRLEKKLESEETRTP